MRMKPYVILLILQFLFFYHISAQPTKNINELMIGMVSPLWGSTLCVDGMQSLTNVQYSTFFTSVMAYGTSLIGYESVVQDQMYIKSSITKINSTHIEIACSCEQLTLATKMKFSYIIIKNTIVFISIYSECFLCDPQNSYTGERSWNFNATQHTTVYSDSIQISSSMSGFNVSNVAGSALDFNVITTMKTTDKFIYHTIKARSWTVVNSICITTIIYDFSKTGAIWSPWKILAQAQLKHISWSSKAIYIKPTHNCFQNSNAMFYGISGINISFQPNIKQVMLFDISMPSDLNANFQGNQNIIDIQLSAFYVIQLNCSLGNFFDPTPSNYNCVTTCPVGMGADITTKYCVKCNSKCATCQGSDINQCLTCSTSTLNNFRQIFTIPGPCVCMPGYIEPIDGSSMCLSCAKLIDNCLKCTSPTQCTLCQGNYTFYPVTNKCGCSNTSQYLSQGFCLSFPGCLQVQYSTNIPAYCILCDSSKNFEIVTQNNTCKCKTNYIFNKPNITCVDLCGDGIVLDLECDDGNTINGDGCSQNCTQQPGYFCVDKTIQQPSLCMLMWNFTISFLYSSRDITSNVGTFVFVLSPIEPKISQMNLTSCLSFSFKSNLVSYAYDSQTGKLTVNTEFGESVEGQSESFTLNMGNVKIKTNQIQADFEVNGMNSWLIRDQYSGMYKYVIYGIVAICFLVWIIVIIISMLGYRHLAIELIFPIQAIYLVLIQEGSNAPGLRALDLMKFIMGYNSLNGFKLKQISSIDDIQYFFLQYLQNLNFFILIDIVLLITMMILKVLHYKKSKLINQQQIQCNSMISQKKNELKRCKNINQINETNKKYDQIIQSQSASIVHLTQQRKPFENALKYLGFRLCNIISLFIIQASIYYMGTYMLFPTSQQTFPQLLNNFSCIVCIALGLSALCIFPGKNDNDIIIFVYKKKYSYTKGYIIWYVLFAGLMVFFRSFGVVGVTLIPIVWISLIIVCLIVRNPYYCKNSRRPRFILPIIQQILLTIPMYLLWVAGFLHTLNPLIYFINTILIVSFCFIGIIITSIRVYFEWRYFQLLQKKVKLQAIEENEQDEKEKKTSQIKDEEENNINNHDKDSKEHKTILKERKTSGEFDDNGLQSDDINIDGVETNKKRRNLRSELAQRKSDDGSDFSDKDKNEQNLQFIKRQLRKQLKRGMKSK